MEEIKRINTSSVSNRIVLTRAFFLRGLALVYLIAFISLYGQIQGLWGDEGLTPSKFVLQRLKETQKDFANFFSFPTLAWVFKWISELNVVPTLSIRFGSYSENFLYVICLIGIAISFVIVLNVKKCINTYSYAIMWYCYLNFVLLGQTFMRYEWDYLLLEVGFVSIAFAPYDYERNINIISNIDNLCFYILRFVLYKVMFCIGSNILGSNCSYWLSFNGLNFYFQSQASLTGLSYYMHNIPDGMKKLMSGFVYFVFEYLPLGYFLIWRRINIYVGQITFIFILIVSLSGNYGFYGLLMIVLNILNFDDYYIRGILHQNILYYLNVDELLPVFMEYVDEMKQKQNELEKINQRNEELVNKLKNEKNVDEKKKIEDELYELRRKSFSLDDYDDYPRIEETLQQTTSLIKEIFMFFNFLCVNLLVVFFWFFPLKNLLPGKIMIKRTKKNDVTTILNIFLIYMFCYIITVIIYNIAQKMRFTLMNSFSITPEILEEIKKRKQQNPNLSSKDISDLDFTNDNSFISSSKQGGICNRIKSISKYFISTFKYLIIIALFIIYFIGSVDSLYTSIGLKLVNEPKPKNNSNDNKKKDLTMPTSPTESFLLFGIGLSHVLYQKFLAFGIYGQIQKEIVGVNGRPELEIEYLEENTYTNWKEIDFVYKLNTKRKPKFLFFMQPRMDYQMHIASKGKDINSEPWLAVLLGKILERNPVILDLLGYDVQEKQMYYKLSMVNKMKEWYLGLQRSEIEHSIKKVKIDLFYYRFIKGKANYIQRKRHSEFLGNIEKYALHSIFNLYGLPEINEDRDIYISPFQFIPVVDVLIIAILVKKIWFNK